MIKIQNVSKNDSKPDMTKDKTAHFTIAESEGRTYTVHYYRCTFAHYTVVGQPGVSLLHLHHPCSQHNQANI